MLGCKRDLEDALNEVLFMLGCLCCWNILQFGAANGFAGTMVGLLGWTLACNALGAVPFGGGVQLGCLTAAERALVLIKCSCKFRAWEMNVNSWW
jgi:hypothetical protein